MENNNKEIRRSVEFNLVEVVVIILITGVIISLFSGLIVYNNYDKLSSSEATAKESDFSEFIESYNHIMKSYVKEVDGDKLIDAAIEGMYNYLNDEYSIYLNEDITNDLEEQLNGKYNGVGIEISMSDNNEIVIARIFSNSPAEKAGLKAGDILINLDGVDLKDKTSSYVADTIKKGTKESFELTYKRDGKSNTIKITRSSVIIESATSKEYDNVGYIKIDTFSANTSEQVENLINKFSSKVTSLVVDVRNNSGGYLTTAREVSDLFIEKGKVIYQLKDKNSKITKYTAKDGVEREFNKISVLINNGSASASEILALALKESANATIIGVKSYGKGTVQEAETLSSGAMVKYTTAYWLSPNGNSINEVGIKPDIEVKDFDAQLTKAIETVK